MGHAVRQKPAVYPAERLTVREGGRIVIPAHLRAALGVSVGDDLLVAMTEDGALRVTTPANALRDLQAFVKSQDRGEGSVVDELIAERRAKAART